MATQFSLLFSKFWVRGGGGGYSEDACSRNFSYGWLLHLFVSLIVEKIEPYPVLRIPYPMPF